jgi:transposase
VCGRRIAHPPPTLRINRAPVLTLWAAVVAERLGIPHETALTVGQALAGLTAYSKGVRLGIHAPPAERPHEAPPPLPKGVKNVRDVHLLGRLVHVAETSAGLRAIAKGELVKPESVERYLRGKFGDALDAVRAETEHLASKFPPEQLNGDGFRLYEQFRPEVPRGKPENLIGDKAYDSDELDASLQKQGVEMIAPHCANRTLKTQDGRRLRRYERRWLVERYFAWLQWKRRILIRWEYYSENFLGFVQLPASPLKRI